MASKKLNIWYDPDADYLDVNMGDRFGVWEEIDAGTQVKLDEQGHLIGFSMNGASRARKRLNIDIPMKLQPGTAQDLSTHLPPASGRDARRKSA